MTILATLRCVEFNQHIYANRKETTEFSFFIQLFSDRLIIKNETIPIRNIFDMSYRKKSDSNAIGFLYIHTNSGVRSLLIKEEPQSFINVYKRIMK